MRYGKYIGQNDKLYGEGCLIREAPEIGGVVVQFDNLGLELDYTHAWWPLDHSEIQYEEE